MKNQQFPGLSDKSKNMSVKAWLMQTADAYIAYKTRLCRAVSAGTLVPSLFFHVHVQHTTSYDVQGS
jgi:hypothetical protein